MICQESDMWETPLQLFNELNDKYGPFELDVCATKSTFKCVAWFGEQLDGTFIDGLKQDWYKHAKSVWCNPPYSRKGKKDKWIEKAAIEAQKGVRIVMIIPANTDTRSFHNYIYKKANVKIEFLKGRPKFLMNGKVKGNGKFPLMVVIFNA